EIISNKSPLFASKFWKNLLETLGTQANLSLAYYPQSNDNWVDLLLLAKFTYNNSIHASMKTSPFFANYSFHLHFNLQVPFYSSVPSVKNKATQLQQIKETLTDKLKIAQEYYKKNADCFYIRVLISKLVTRKVVDLPPSVIINEEY
ncbi:13337_t:CDS:2, partial [Ambispora leptoticha]